MLRLTRMPGESIFIGKDIQVIVTQVQGQKVKIGIIAPPELLVLRNELKERADDRQRGDATR